MSGIKAALGATAFLEGLERIRLFIGLQEYFAGLNASLTQLKGEEWTVSHTRLYVSGAVAQGYAACAACLLVSAAAGEASIGLLGPLFLLLLPAARLREVKKAALKRKQELLLALPDLLGKLQLLIGAGETMNRALARCAVRTGDCARNGLLYTELARAVQGINNGHSFPAAMEAFSRRCGVQEVSIFTTVLLLNYRRGGEQLALSLREISLPLWEKRKSTARARGEEASSKLVFPLIGIFFLLMVLVGSPAMLMMNG